MKRSVVFVVLALLFLAPRARSQEQAIRINPSGADLYRIAIVGSGPSIPIVQNDLDLTGYFRILDARSFPPGLLGEPHESMNANNWLQVAAQAVTKIQPGSAGEIHCNLFEIAKGDTPVLTRRYSGGDARAVAHLWAEELVHYFTGEPGFFGTQFAFVSGGRKSREIYVMDFDGANAHRVTQMNAVSILPSWSPSGRDLWFLSYLFGSPDMWTVSAQGGRARRVTRSGRVLSGAAMSPDGSRMAVSLSIDGNPEIYLLRTDGSTLRRLTDSPGIDTSPSFSPDGSQIAFVSNRLGNPQIFVMGSDGGGARRLTYQGTYNQTPKWCPRKETPLIAFTARDEHLRFDIFIVDARSGKVERLTQNQGNNEDPTWAPNCRAIAYQSSRGGIYMLNPNTRIEHQIYRGNAEQPRWGPLPRRQ